MTFVTLLAKQICYDYVSIFTSSRNKVFKDSESILRAASSEVKLPVSNAYYNLFFQTCRDEKKILHKKNPKKQRSFVTF